MVDTKALTHDSPGIAARVAPLMLYWHRAALGAILAVATVLNFLHLDQEGYGNTYYAAAVRSMLESWHNFLFVSFDPGGFVAVDKPPLGFWIQTASAWLFGFHGWSILAPEALAGVLSVLVLYKLVTRVYGPIAGLVAAGVLAVTPISVATSRNNTIDSLLVLDVLLAAWAMSRAVESPRRSLPWLLAAATIVGLGFNIKMAEAYLVVPALWLMYLVAAPVGWRRRVAHLMGASLVLLVVSLSWATFVDLTPADQRPYVDSTQDNSEMNLIVGHNGIERVAGGLGRRFGLAGAFPQLFGTPGEAPTQPAGQPDGGANRPARNADPGQQPGQFRAAGFGGETGAPGPLRLFTPQLGGQVSWLIPLAVFGLLVAAVQRRRTGSRPGRRAAAVVLWGTWLLTVGGFFSLTQGMFHTYYMVMFAPAPAALAGIGLVSLWTSAHESSSAKGIWRLVTAVLLPVGLLGTATVELVLLSRYPDWSARLVPLMAVLCVVGSALVLVARLGSWRAARVERAAYAAVGLWMMGLLVAPAVWAAMPVFGANRGSNFPSAGPAQLGRFGGFAPNGQFAGRGVGETDDQDQAAADSDAPGPPDATARAQAFANLTPGQARPAGAFAGRGDDADTKLTQYLLANQGGTEYLAATLRANNAAPLIIATGKPVMAIGGFMGAAQILTLDHLEGLVADNTVRFFLLDGGFPGTFGFQTAQAVPQRQAGRGQRAAAPDTTVEPEDQSGAADDSSGSDAQSGAAVAPFQRGSAPGTSGGQFQRGNQTGAAGGQFQRGNQAGAAAAPFQPGDQPGVAAAPFRRGGQSTITSWVSQNCTAVPVADWQTTSPARAQSRQAAPVPAQTGPGAGPRGEELFDCSASATSESGALASLP